MAKVKADSSFIRDGRPIEDWLIELVSDDRAVRARAANALGGMQLGIPLYSTDWADLETLPESNQSDRFGVAVRAAVDGESFPKIEFVNRLLALRYALGQENQKHVGQKRTEFEEHAAREENLIDRMVNGSTESVREQAARRFRRHFCASLERDNRRVRQLESFSATGMLSICIFNALDTALLSAPAMLRLLYSSKDRHMVMDALVRIGSPAAPFADLLLHELDHPSENQRWFDGARALASISRNNAQLVEELFARLVHPDARIRGGAIACLEFTGPELAGRETDFVVLLQALCARRDDPCFLSAVIALGAVGRAREDVSDFLVDLAKSRPPQLRKYSAGEGEYEYDHTMYERAAAIDALRFMTAFSSKVVPALIDAFDSFEEYDPDCSYSGNQERVCRSLQAFGSAAAPAIPRLIKELEIALTADGDREYPKDVVSVLKAIGPAASEAIAANERLPSSFSLDEG